LNDDIMGVVYALPSHMIQRFFEGKDVFVKFTGQPSTRLVKGHRLFFYASHGQKHLLGEATIEKVDFLTPRQVIDQFGSRLFLSSDEVRQYVHRQHSRKPDKSMLVLELRERRRYRKPIKFTEHMTMAGRYMTRNLYNKLKQGH